MNKINKNIEEIIYDACEMYQIDGEREGSYIFFLDGYSYHREIRAKNLTQKQKLTKFRCAFRSYSKKGCTATVETMINGKLRLTGHHKCDKDVHFLEERNMYHTLQHEALNNPAPPHTILSEISLRAEFANVNSRFSIFRADSIIKRIRRISRPIPNNLQELGERCALDATNPVHKHYRGQVQFIDTDTNEQTALIFASDDMLISLNSARKIFIDGVMKPIPTRPEARQLWVIHIQLKPGVTLPAVYAYCNGAKGGLYTAVLERIVELAPALKRNLLTVMTDFEAAEINAIRHVFPHVRLRCCWFHYNQAVTARWYHLDLDEAPQIILFFAWQLALAPSTRYEEGLRIIAKRIALHEDEFPKLHLFHNYLLTQWLPKACLLSVFEEDDRTNNPAEAWNRHLTKELGGCKPPLWTLLYNLDKYIKVTNNKLTRVLANVKISKSYQTKRQREDNERIERCQAKLSSGEYDLDKFLFESINKQRQQEIFEEIKFLQKDNSGVGSRNLAATDILLDVENAIQDPPNVSMSLLPSSRLRPQKIEKTKKATSSDTLQQMTVQEANQRVQNLANKKMEGYVQLEGEEYGSKKRRKWKSKRAGTRGCYTDQPNLKNKNIGFRSTKNTKKKSSETIKVMQPLQNSSKASVEFEENFHGVSRSFAPANVMKEAIPEENEKGNFNDDGDFTDIEFLDEKLLQEMDGN